jgi:hypothetical protein
VGERGSGIVVAGDRDQRRSTAKGRDIVGHVTSAADAMALVIEDDDRDRRFWRETRNSPRDERIQHRVADDEHVGSDETGYEGPCSFRCDRRQHQSGAQPRMAA